MKRDGQQQESHTIEREKNSKMPHQGFEGERKKILQPQRQVLHEVRYERSQLAPASTKQANSSRIASKKDTALGVEVPAVVSSSFIIAYYIIIAGACCAILFSTYHT